MGILTDIGQTVQRPESVITQTTGCSNGARRWMKVG
jgi:hypothetical protein